MEASEGKPITSTDIAFKLAPRLNALGRLGSALSIVDLLLSEDPIRIAELIRKLESTNRARKEIEDQIYQEAIQKIESGGSVDPVIVLADERWHVLSGSALPMVNETDMNNR